MKREDRQTLMLTHLSQLLNLVTGIGGLIVPLILWQTQKDTIEDMDEHGKAIMNFQLSMLIYSLICIPLIIVVGLGFIGLIVIGLFTLIFPIVNAIKANNGDPINYPLSIRLIK
ncbi:DUF4870 domain-containing protein [Zhouia sp. PK063]|uniref:DUF4870 domain-containing protein n=1 Tax=Zhouia sp. PK063 TaxID=3373602 RepID=UPI0037988F17